MEPANSEEPVLSAVSWTKAASPSISPNHNISSPTTSGGLSKTRTPIWGYLMRTPRLFYLGYTVPHSIPSRPNQRPMKVEYFQAQRPSRANQPRAFTQATASKHWSPHSVRVRVRVGWYLLTLGDSTIWVYALNPIIWAYGIAPLSPCLQSTAKDWDS